VRKDVDSSDQTTVSERNAKSAAMAAAEGRANNQSCEWSRSSGAPFLSTLHAFFR
jgi:hypothetical protein